MFSFIVLYMLIRWTIPRFRFDQLMKLAWQALAPLAFLNFVAVMFVKQFGVSEWWLLPISCVLFVGFVRNRVRVLGKSFLENGTRVVCRRRSWPLPAGPRPGRS